MTVEERNKIVVEHLGWMRRIVHARTTRPDDFDDTLSRCCVAMLERAHRFDHTRGSFRVFMSRRIVGEVIDERRRGAIAGRSRDSNVKTTIQFKDGLHGNPAGRDQESSASFLQLIVMLERLPPRAAYALLGCGVGDMKLHEVGADLGVTEGRACQLLAEARHGMRAAMGENHV